MPGEYILVVFKCVDVYVSYVCLYLGFIKECFG